ncbi:hypothetical protein CBM2605_U10023 [Cupriavidus neocaledonicus]|uniref:Uncharacterized protein n=1 Tax=Cupriavidus neocaledonicus TaxID=1040979 RepID=A0ABY1VEX9_9BURK|nr:hypothetical protein CBM2605_U10023 [Cupriavidus neocaledonicus]
MPAQFVIEFAASVRPSSDAGGGTDVLDGDAVKATLARHIASGASLRIGGATCTAVARRGKAGCPSSADNGRPSRVPDATALASQNHGLLGQPLDPALRDPELLPGRTRAAASGSAERAMMKLVV